MNCRPAATVADRVLHSSHSCEILRFPFPDRTWTPASLFATDGRRLSQHWDHKWSPVWPKKIICTPSLKGDILWQIVHMQFLLAHLSLPYSPANNIVGLIGLHLLPVPSLECSHAVHDMLCCSVAMLPNLGSAKLGVCQTWETTVNAAPHLWYWCIVVLKYCGIGHRWRTNTSASVLF